MLLLGMQLHHLAIGARDVRAVAEFYRDGFRLPVLKEHFYESGALRAIWLEMGPTILMIERTEETRSVVNGVGTGPFLLAFKVTPEERASFEGQLAALGAPIESRTDASTYFRDPESNRVAISHYQRE